jgi:hypothetical protein
VSSRVIPALSIASIYPHNITTAYERSTRAGEDDGRSCRKIRKVTIAEFDAFVAGLTDVRDYELVGGVIVLMSNPTETREQIAANIGAPEFNVDLAGVYFDLTCRGARLRRPRAARSSS